MAKVHICNVRVLDEVAKFTEPYRFEITFDVLEDLKHDLDWQLVYVGSGSSDAYDQILDEVAVGPLAAGRHSFIFDAPAPDFRRIPAADLLGVTLVMLVCRYLNQNFVRVHYFVRVEYSDPALNDVPPQVVDVDKLQRTILASNPRVTKFYIDWAGDGTGFELPLGPPAEVPSDEVSLEKNGLPQTSVLFSASDQPDGRCVASDLSAGPLIESNSGDMVVPNSSPTSSTNNTSTVEPQTETPLANTQSSELNVHSS